MSNANDFSFDADRLAALNDLSILDTPPEGSFDEIVEIVSVLCDVPIALVSLVDRDRQWFKARKGIDLEETPIEQSVCALAIRQSDIFVIEDLAADPRTGANPLVTAADGIRFYAGAPLVTSAGFAIGSLCAIDTKPRPGGLTDRQESAMRALAVQVVKELEARHAANVQAAAVDRAERAKAAAAARLERSIARGDALEKINQRARSAQEAGRIGTFEVDIASDMVALSAEGCRLFGLPVRAAYPAGDLEALVLKDEGTEHSTFADRIDGSSALDVEYRIRRAHDGQVRWISRRGAFAQDGEGRVTSLRGTIHDVTERRLAGERIAAMLKLGDQLRDLDDVGDIAAATSQILCSTLNSARCGYASIDLQGGTITVESDCPTGDAQSIVGTYSFAMFSGAIEALRGGQILAQADVEIVPELSGQLASYREMQVRAQINVPLIDRNELKGILFVHDREVRAWDMFEIDFVESVADRAYATIAKVRAETDRQMLNNELSHRLKNTLSLIQAIAQQTLKTVTEREAVEAFDKRLRALGAAHDVLMQQNWTEAWIGQVVAGVLANLGIAARVDASGAAMLIGSRAVLGISLLIHELATNALKYGALSNPAGRVSLEWTVDDVGQEPQLKLTWREQGGPEVAEPARKGFGSRLISLGLLGTGGAQLRFLPKGLEAEFVATVSQSKSA